MTFWGKLARKIENGDDCRVLDNPSLSVKCIDCDHGVAMGVAIAVTLNTGHKSLCAALL